MFTETVIVLSALVVTAIIYLFIRDRQLLSGMKSFLEEGKYKSRAQPPVEAPFVYEKHVQVICYDGQIKNNTPYTLMLGNRITGEGKDSVSYRYIGFYFPPQVPLSEDWLNAWKQKVNERCDQWADESKTDNAKHKWGAKGPPDTLPIRAERVNGGGVILAWNGLHIRDHVQARINDVLASL